MWRVCVIGESTTGIGHGLGCESDAHRRAQTTEEGTAHERVLFCFLVFHDSLTTPPSRKNRNVTKCMLCSCCRRAVNAVRAPRPRSPSSSWKRHPLLSTVFFFWSWFVFCDAAMRSRCGLDVWRCVNANIENQRGVSRGVWSVTRVMGRAGGEREETMVSALFPPHLQVFGHLFSEAYWSTWRCQPIKYE